MNDSKSPFTVIGFYEDDREIFYHHVMADSLMNAFAVGAAKCQREADMVAALPGHLSAAKGEIALPGVDIMDGDTVLEHSEIFGGASQD